MTPNPACVEKNVVSPGFWTKRQTFLRYEKQSTGVLTLCCTVPQKIEAYCRSLKPYIYIYLLHIFTIIPKNYISPHFITFSLTCSWLNPCKSQCFWVKTHISIVAPFFPRVFPMVFPFFPRLFPWFSWFQRFHPG